MDDGGAAATCPDKQAACLLQPDAPVRLLFYCGRSLGYEDLSTDGSCGPNKGHSADLANDPNVVLTGHHPTLHQPLQIVFVMWPCAWCQLK